MHTLIQFQFIVLLFVLVRAGDIAIGAAYTRDTIRALVYGIVALLALIAVILTLLGL